MDKDRNEDAAKLAEDGDTPRQPLDSNTLMTPVTSVLRPATVHHDSHSPLTNAE